MDILTAIGDANLFAPWFRDPTTWAAWRSFLAALFALPMDEEQLGVYREHTGRTAPPSTEFNEAYLVCGRRAGKSFVLALTAVYLAAFKNYAQYLAPGERGTLRVMASDRDQSRAIFRYITALLRDVPMLGRMVERETAESFELSNRTIIEVGTASFRASRGYTFIGALCDEVAFWRMEESTNPDVEILRALRPGLLTIPNSKLLVASSPYAKRGVLWDAYQRYFGRDDAPVLVWKATTRDMNSTIPEADVAAEMEKARLRLQRNIWPNFGLTLKASFRSKQCAPASRRIVASVPRCGSGAITPSSTRAAAAMTR